jgi:hypothetical protein
VAGRFLELWQEQWAGFVNNPETAAQMGRFMEMMTPAARSMFTPPETPHATSQAKDTSGAAATAAALESLAGGLVDLARRVDALGQRLERMEQSGQRKPAARAAKTSRSGAGTGSKRKAKPAPRRR